MDAPRRPRAGTACASWGWPEADGSRPSWDAPPPWAGTPRPRPSPWGVEMRGGWGASGRGAACGAATFEDNFFSNRLTVAKCCGGARVAGGGSEFGGRGVQRI